MALAKRGEGRRSGEGFENRVETERPKLEKWEAFCAEMGERPADVALAWLLANPVVTAPIIGPRTVEQLDESLRALEIKLDEDAMRRLAGIFPGPGKPAPEAYAW